MYANLAPTEIVPANITSAEDTSSSARLDATVGTSTTGAMCGIMMAAITVNEADLPDLSVVLDTALCILYARAAVIKLVSHVGLSATSTKALNLCPPPRLKATWAAYARPWVSSWIPGDGVEDEADAQGYAEASLSDDTAGETTARTRRVEIRQRFLEVLKDGQCQQYVVDLTKVFAG